MNLRQNPWYNWGFLGNPFDTSALSSTSKLLPISKAFVGRTILELPISCNNNYFSYFLASPILLALAIYFLTVYSGPKKRFYQ